MLTIDPKISKVIRTHLVDFDDPDVELDLGAHLYAKHGYDLASIQNYDGAAFRQWHHECHNLAVRLRRPAHEQRRTAEGE